MNDESATEAEQIEDIGAAIREGRPIREARSFRIAVGDEGLTFRPVILNDPVPVGRQILAAAGLANVEVYGLFAILPNGDFEEVRLDETFDLRAKGTEKFVGFRSDREFRLTLDGRELRW